MGVESFVGIIDFRGIILKGDSDTLKRHSSYGAEIAKLSKGRLNLIIFSAYSQEQVIPVASNITFIAIKIKKYQLLRYSKQVSKYILRDMSSNPKILVAGDPWESFWSAWLIRRLVGKKTPIQVQIHGDVTDSNWTTLTSRNRIRNLFTRFAAEKSDTIRLTSELQKMNFLSRFPSTSSKIIVAPVPLNLSEKPVIERRDRTISLGLVGRIEPDRGLSAFVDLVKKISKENAQFTVDVIGDGPVQTQFMESLIEILGSKRVNFYGKLSGQELQETWERIGVLASIAPSESYGRAIRESIYFGVPVWGIASSGVKDAANQFPGSVSFLDLNLSSRELNETFEMLLTSQIPIEISKEIYESNLANATRIAKSWIIQ